MPALIVLLWPHPEHCSVLANDAGSCCTGVGRSHQLLSVCVSCFDCCRYAIAARATARPPSGSCEVSSAQVQVSPRTFWALVRHGGVSATVSFENALQRLLPKLDWGKLRVDSRLRKRPEKLRQDHTE